MAAHRVTGANYEAHYPLIRGQFVKQIKAVCDIDCQNNQHSFQLLFLLTEICRERYFACLPTLSSMCLVIRRVLETEAAESLVLYIRCREQRVTNKRTMNVQGFLNYQLLLHLKCILRVTCRRNKYYKHCFSSYSCSDSRTPILWLYFCWRMLTNWTSATISYCKVVVCCVVQIDRHSTLSLLQKSQEMNKVKGVFICCEIC